MWAAYISVSLMFINKIIAEYDQYYQKLLFDPLRLAFNSSFVLFIDLIFLVICWIIILYYHELGHIKSGYYYLTIFIYGVATILRLKARLYVFKELSSFE
jgi:hypothetical protein